MNIDQKVKKIIFLNDLQETDGYIRNNIEFNAPNVSNSLFIAMRPTINSYLKQRELCSQNTHPYFTNDSHAKVLEKSEILVDWLRKNSNFVDLDMGIQCAYRESLIFWTRFAIHHCLWVIEIVLNAVDKHQPEILSAFSSGKKNVSSLYLEPEEKYLGYVVRIIAEQKGLRFEDIPENTSKNPILCISRSINYINTLFKFILGYGKFQLCERKISVRNIFTKRDSIFFTTRFYQMDKLAGQLQKKYSHKHFYFLQGPVLPSFKISGFSVKLFWRANSKIIEDQKRLFRNLITAIREETTLFSYKSISFADIISKKIEDNIVDYIVKLILWTIKLNQFIDLSAPSGFISNGNRADDVALAELCKQKNIPTILISHGSHIRPKNIYENIEWGEHGKALLRAPFSYLALQTPLSEEYLEIFPTKSRVIKTGPLIWGKPVNTERSETLFKKMFNEKNNFKEVKVILHAGTPKASNTLRLYVYETPDEYIQALCDLANTVEKVPNTILIIKFRPSGEISVEDLKALVPFSEKVVLSVDESFSDVLGMADLLVSFSSTTIEEALQNKIPVLLYGGGGRYQHIPAYEISLNNSMQLSAVYHVKESKDLAYAIDRILRLKVSGEENAVLFEPYIYAQNVREPFTELLKL